MFPHVLYPRHRPPVCTTLSTKMSVLSSSMLGYGVQTYISKNTSDTRVCFSFCKQTCAPVALLHKLVFHFSPLCAHIKLCFLDHCFDNKAMGACTEDHRGPSGGRGPSQSSTKAPTYSINQSWGKIEKCVGLLNTPNYHNYHNSSRPHKSQMIPHVALCVYNPPFARVCYTAVCWSTGPRSALCSISAPAAEGK